MYVYVLLHVEYSTKNVAGVFRYKSEAIEYAVKHGLESWHISEWLLR